MRVFLSKNVLLGVILWGAALGGSLSLEGQQQQSQQLVVLDRVIAIINGDVLLESDLEEELRYSVLQPYSAPPGTNTRTRAMQRLINRTLILQQIHEMNLVEVQPKEAEVDQRIAELRKQLPACLHAHCDTEEGWRSFLKENRFTEDQVKEHWRQRLMILAFIEARFRSGIHIQKEDISEYYQKTLTPQFEREKLHLPDLKLISGRIEEILLQQKVNELLQDWLKSLRQRGGVEILEPEFKSLASPDEDDEE